MAKRSSRPALNTLPPELRSLVRETVALLGQIICHELGEKAYQRIESVRKRMAKIRTASEAIKARELESAFLLLERLSSEERRNFARSYTLMFELMNACENAYRTYRLRQRTLDTGASEPFSAQMIFYVLTAHPTEARAPENIEIFHEIQNALVVALENGFVKNQERIRALLAVAWNVRIVRYRKPRVQDEAEHVYSVALRDENLSLLLDFAEEAIPVYLRSWVGGDKDGHPGVDLKTMQASLQLSRDLLYRYAVARTKEMLDLLALVDGNTAALQKEGTAFMHALTRVRKLGPADGRKMIDVHRALESWISAYQERVGPLPLPLSRLSRLLRTFQGLVIPLELREDSAVLLSDPSGKSLAIGGMLRALGRIAAGAEARWYARGMIISMASTTEHVRVAAEMVRKNLRDSCLRIVPLFEQREALENAPAVLKAIFQDPKLKKLLRKEWGSRFEVMLGYSDSSKESGVLKSRLAVVDAMMKIDRVCAEARVQPIFFHGSGGSIDRGGGSVSEQMAPWPKSALEIYKATIQGEMVERTFASPEIARSRFEKISHAYTYIHAERYPVRTPKYSAALEKFANQVAEHYAKAIASKRFLQMVECATPYRYLSALKIGSRPTKRGGALSVPSLRAIPWVLCWTQTRVLFQTWWGIGSAWKEMSVKERASLRREYRTNPLFGSFVQALGFTIAKVELSVWEFYLKCSGLPQTEVEYFREAFRKEFAATLRFFRELTGKSDPLWFRPWLAKSIELRASMIHPLNLLEIMAQEDRDLPLLRLCVTGIASGMLTTG